MGFGTRTRTEETRCMGGEGIRDSMMNIGVMAHTGMTCWIGAVGTLHVMIVFGIGVENFVTSGTFFVAISFISLGVQKKEYSEDGIGCGDVGTFNEDAISFMFSASEFQKKDKSETDFMQGVTGEETTFLGELIQRVLTC